MSRVAGACGALLLALAPLGARAADPVWVAPAERPGSPAPATANAGCEALSLWLDGAPGSGVWALRPAGGAASVPELVGTWHHDRPGLAAVATEIRPDSGSYLLVLSGAASAERAVAVDCPDRVAAPLAPAPGPGPMAPVAAPMPASVPTPAPEPGPALVVGCLLITVALLASANWSHSTGLS